MFSEKKRNSFLLGLGPETKDATIYEFSIFSIYLHCLPDMYLNVALLEKRGAQFIGPEEGELACGYEGLGRLAAPEAISEAALQLTGLSS